ncbi:MAG: DUF4363 family protein [Bacillota bacterium]
MSKRIIILIIILSVVLSLALLEETIIKNTFESLEFRLNQMDVAIENDTINEIDIDNLIGYWERRKRLLCMIVPHIEIRNIEIYLYQLKNAVENQEYFEASEYIEVLLSQSRSIPKTFVLCLENIL